MRNNIPSSMQKTYDECYLICSTAVYFEGKGNEEEALRSWRSALDQIYYHNAYRVPPNYRPKSETEKALQDSLRDMEMQCKERVDLLEALRRSRLEAKKGKDSSRNGETLRGRPPAVRTPGESMEEERKGYLGQGTVRAVDYPDLSRRPPPLPQRPATSGRTSSESQISGSQTIPQKSTPASSLALSQPTVPVPSKLTSRTPSPEKKGRMLTTLRPGKDGKRPSRSPRPLGGRRTEPPAASKAAGLAWDNLLRTSGNRLGQNLADHSSNTTTVNPVHRNTSSGSSKPAPEPVNTSDGDAGPSRSNSGGRTSSSPEVMSLHDAPRPTNPHTPDLERQHVSLKDLPPVRPQTMENTISSKPPAPPPHTVQAKEPHVPKNKERPTERLNKPPMDYISYRSEYPVASSSSKTPAPAGVSKSSGPSNIVSTSVPKRQRSPLRKSFPPVVPTGLSRRPVPNTSTHRDSGQREPEKRLSGSSGSGKEQTSSSRDGEAKPRRSPSKTVGEPMLATPPTDPTSINGDSAAISRAARAWDERVKYLTKHLPKGVDENAAKQIFNEIVVKGDEVHWDDVAGLDVAKKALKEAVVYPFLRPDLFMGLREPARGMLLFGPPGTGKTMLARAVATESKSTFFAISASSLTSKYLGESEKLVRALFALAKALAPSIIFVDEIDSLLSSRGGSSEHESTRRIKTEFLIQWSDLQRAAAGKEQSDKEKKEGDASRVLVLAATNMPWAIDEAARRRFVRRQYIPLPESHVRAMQLRTLLSHQKHSLTEDDIEVLVQLTDAFSGSDITALAKDAAMGPLRSLGEALLHMSMEEIRPIQFVDFEASLVNIRPS
ncbi:MAG: hypothetical protein M1830_004255, partial [Pleopsidium flavum]